MSDSTVGQSGVSHEVDPESDLGRFLVAEIRNIRVHDDHCYMNVGAICTKCGAACYEGQFVGGVAVSR